MQSQEDEIEVLYEVDEILNKRAGKDGKAQYLIKWKGFKQRTWEPITNLSNVAQMIYQYQLTNKNNRSKADHSKNIMREAKQTTAKRKRLSKISHRESETSYKADRQSSIDSRREEYLVDSREEEKQQIQDRPRIKFTKEYQHETKPSSSNCQRGSPYVDDVEQIVAVEKQGDKWMAKVKFVGRYEDIWEERDIVRLLHPFKLLEFYEQLHRSRQNS